MEYVENITRNLNKSVKIKLYNGKSVYLTKKMVEFINGLYTKDYKELLKRIKSAYVKNSSLLNKIHKLLEDIHPYQGELDMEAEKYRDETNYKYLDTIVRAHTYLKYTKQLFLYHEFQPGKVFNKYALSYGTEKEIGEAIDIINNSTKFYAITVLPDHYIIFHKNSIWKHKLPILNVYIDDKLVSIAIGRYGSNIKRMVKTIKKDFNKEVIIKIKGI